MIVASCQFYPQFKNPKNNALRISEVISRSASEGTKIIVFPECALTGYCFSSKQEAFENALEKNDECILKIQKTCEKEKILSIVGFAEKEGNNLFNSAIIISPSGFLGVYRKTHLPLLGLDKFVVRGDALPVYEYENIKFGVLICYDVRIPEAARILALKGAQIIFVPTNWPEGAQSASDLVCPTRAIENHLFVVSSNRVGQEQGFRFIGKSKIIAPGGQIISSADNEEETVIAADINPEIANNKHIVKKRGEYEMQLFESRRPELYSELDER